MKSAVRYTIPLKVKRPDQKQRRYRIKPCRAVTDVKPGAFSLSKKERCPLPCLDPSCLLQDTTTELLQIAKAREGEYTCTASAYVYYLPYRSILWAKKSK